jgi:prevent-host-death family protein
MTRIVNVHEAKTHFSKLLEQAHAGEEIILAKAGKPYARLLPLPPASGARRPGRLKGTLGDAFFEALPEDELRAWDDG